MESENGTASPTENDFDESSYEPSRKKIKGDGGLSWKNGPTAVAESNSTPLASLTDGVKSRRRSTRASQRLQVTEEDDIDDPEYQQLSDSDDDPDFAPSFTKDTTPEFTYKGKGRGRGRGKYQKGYTPIKGKSRGKGRSSVGNNNVSSSATKVKKTPSATSSTTASPAPSNVSRTASPCSSNDSSASSLDNTEKNTSMPNTTPNTTSSTPSTNSVSASIMSPNKLHSAVNYPVLKRQSQAVRLPEGPQLTPEQLKEIEAQFKNGDFVMAKKDMELENPPIWRIDGKSLLQKFQAFEKDGKTLYRNISTYSGWTTQSKTLYVPVKATFIFQSRYDTVVELTDSACSDPPAKTGAASTTAPSAAITDKRDFSKSGSVDETIVVPEELNQHMATFEIFLQTLISQALDSNFLAEIYEENDVYFVERVKIIEDLTESRKEKLKLMTKWGDDFQKSLEVWPCVNIMSSVSSDSCEACCQSHSAKLALFYGQPYDNTTLKPKDDSDKQAPNKNYNVCERCSRLCQTYNAICHRKYDYYTKCKTTVTNIRVTQPSKNTTTILRELLGNDTWITGLFRAMCTGFARVDRLYDEHTKTNHDNLKLEGGRAS